MPWTTEMEIRTALRRPESPSRPGGRGGQGHRHRPRPGPARSNPRRHRARPGRKGVYRRRRIAALLVLLVICAVPVLFAYVGLPGSPTRQSSASFSRIEPPLLSAAPTVAGAEATASAVPEDKTLSLTVPKLGLYGHTVQNDDSAEALDSGAIKIPETGFPWQEGANTYISGHRIGYAGTESYYQFLNLPSMEKGDEVLLKDANGDRYTYRVFKVFAVEPTDVWVTEPIAGRDVVTLQTCTESVDDWTTLGPELMYSSPDTGRLIVRAERV